MAKLPPQVAPFSDLEVVEAAAEAVAYRSDFGQGYRNRNNLTDRTKNPSISDIFTLGRWDDGTNESLTKHLMFQVLFF